MHKLLSRGDGHVGLPDFIVIYPCIPACSMNSSRDNHLWLQLWRDNDTEFHQQAVNQLLTRFWPQQDHARGSRVFVPLCGKSLDMIWLADRGYAVTGVELSPIAAQAFFDENGLQPVKSQSGQFTRWQAGNICILCGDYFQLDKTDLGHIDTVYDRAALTALPEDLRIAYVKQLGSIVPQTADVFLLTIEDPDENHALQKMPAVDTEISTLYGAAFNITLAHMETVYEPDNNLHAEYKVYMLSARTDI